MKKIFIAFILSLSATAYAADNIAITPGSGDTVASDDVGGAKHQRVKVEFGADGTATEVSATTPLPVQSTGTTTVAGTVTANAGTNLNTSLLCLEAGGNLATTVASLSVLDDWDESDRAKVNLIVGQAGVAAGAGVNGATVQRVTMATDQAPYGVHNSTSIVTSAGSYIVKVDTFANVAASQTAQVLVAQIAGTKICVLSAIIASGGTATNITFNSSTTAKTPLLATGANSGGVMNYNPACWFTTETNENLTITTGTGSTSGILVGYLKLPQ